MLNHFKQHFVLWFVFIVTIIWIVNTFILDDHVERHELPDDSVIVVLGQEKKHRFKIPVDYLRLSPDYKFKKIYHSDGHFYIYATYPDMKATDPEKPRSDYDNWVSISIGVDTEPSPPNGKKHGRLYLAYQKDPGNGIVPEGFGSTDVTRFEKEEWDMDKYFYQEGVIYMNCMKGKPTENISPSCQIHSSYKDLELSAGFSNQYKAEFLKIESLVQELFASFEQP